MNNTAINTYIKNEIETSTPLQRVVMLYDGVICFLEEAKDMMINKKYTEATISNIRAQNIITELKNSLNMEYGELPERLNRLYSYFLKRLISANIERNPQIIDEVLKSFKDIKDTWDKLYDQEKGGI